MKPFVLCLVALVIIVFPQVNVEATPINVFQGDTLLGTITPYTGTTTGEANYDYYSASGHPINGPTPVYKEGQIFFYDGADGLNFNAIFNVDKAPNSPGKVLWYIGITGSTTDPVVRLSDDDGTYGELAEIGDNVFRGRWYYNYNTDGGVIGEIDGAKWAVTIDPYYYLNVDSLKVFDSSGSYITLKVNTTDAIMMTPADTPTTVPAPTTICLVGIGMLGLLGTGVRHRRRNK